MEFALIIIGFMVLALAGIGFISTMSAGTFAGIIPAGFSFGTVEIIFISALVFVCGGVMIYGLGY